MLEKTIHSIVYLIVGIECIILGFTCIFVGDNILKLALTLASISLVANGLIKIWNCFTHHPIREKLTFLLLKGILDISVALFIVYNLSFVYHSVIILFGVYVLVNALILLITYLLYIRYHIKGLYFCHSFNSSS